MNRYRPKIQWKSSTYSHTFFRLYEFLVGRKAGVRAESSVFSYKDENGVWQYTYKLYSFEAKVVYTEIFVRKYIKDMYFQTVRTLKYWNWKLNRIIPQIQGTFKPQFAFQGFYTIPKTETHNKAWVFAIAFDTAGQFSPISTAYTITGSNTILLANTEHAGTTDNESTPTYGGVSVTNINKGSNVSVFQYAWYKLAAAGTANFIPDTSNAAVMCIASYSGVKQTAPDANTKTNTTASTSISVSHTPIADNCWIVCFTAANSGSTLTGGSNATKRAGNEQAGVLDTNAAITPAAATTQSFTLGASVVSIQIQVSIAPFIAPVNNTLTASQGSYTLTGENINLGVGKTIILAFGSYTLTGFSLLFTYFQKWVKQVMHTSSETNQSLHSSSWTDQSKNSSSETNQTKN